MVERRFRHDEERTYHTWECLVFTFFRYIVGRSQRSIQVQLFGLLFGGRLHFLQILFTVPKCLVTPFYTNNGHCGKPNRAPTLVGRWFHGAQKTICSFGSCQFLAASKNQVAMNTLAEGNGIGSIGNCLRWWKNPGRQQHATTRVSSCIMKRRHVVKHEGKD